MEAERGMFDELLDIDDVQRIGPDDHECLAELRDVLAKHGKLERFGLTLLHSHFPVAADEVLVETCDSEARELTIRPAKQSDYDQSDLVETSWRLSDGATLVSCVQVCVIRNGKHAGRKEHGEVR